MKPEHDKITRLATVILTALPDSAAASPSSSGSPSEDMQLVERGALGDKPDEVTVLERRVLAHERILLALIGHLCNDDAEILRQLKTRFGRGHDLGAYEQDFASTEHFGQQFMRRVQGEVDHRNQ